MSRSPEYCYRELVQFWWNTELFLGESYYTGQVQPLRSVLGRWWSPPPTLTFGMMLHRESVPQQRPSITQHHVFHYNHEKWTSIRGEETFQNVCIFCLSISKENCSVWGDRSGCCGTPKDWPGDTLSFRFMSSGGYLLWLLYDLRPFLFSYLKSTAPHCLPSLHPRFPSPVS